MYFSFRNYEVVAGTARWTAYLHQKFPEEKEAINRYFEMVKDTESFETLNGLLKLIPLWLAWIIGKIYFFKENYLVFFMQESREIKPEEGAFSLFILGLDELMQ